MEEVKRENEELRAKSERDEAALQELRRGREEDKRTIRVVGGNKRAADLRAEEARDIAEQQQLLIDKLQEENKQFFRQV